jgi:hypothetical protein
MKFVIAAMTLLLAGCATSTPAPETSAVAGAHIVPIGQPRRISGSETHLSGPQHNAIADQMADRDRALFQIEAALKIQVPGQAVTDILLTDAAPNGWRCGQVAFAGSAPAMIVFAAHTGATQAEVILGNEAVALDRVRSLCGRS